MQFIETERKPYFLIKMTATPDDTWEEEATQAMFGEGAYDEYWKPGTPMPGDLPLKIVTKLNKVRVEKGKPVVELGASRPPDAGSPPEESRAAVAEREGLTVRAFIVGVFVF